MKQFCETSFKNRKLGAELTASYQCGLRFFRSICLKFCACHEKVMPGHTKCCTCHATPLRKSVPRPLNISDEHVFCTAPATRNASFQILFECPAPAIVFGNATKTLVDNEKNPLHRPHETTSERPKVVRGRLFLALLTSKCALRHNGLHFFDTTGAPTLVCFVHFDLDMCFAPQRRATFHLSSGQMAPHSPPGATNHWKNTAFRDFPPFMRTCIFFLLMISLL